MRYFLVGVGLTFLGYGQRSDNARGTIQSPSKRVSSAPSGALPGNPKDAPESVERVVPCLRGCLTPLTHGPSHVNFRIWRSDVRVGIVCAGSLH